MRLQAILGATIALFPHVAILSLLNAGPVWWFVLVLSAGVLYTLRAADARREAAAMAEMFGAIKSGRATIREVEIPTERSTDETQKRDE